ncbi:hypothetical protein CBOM_03926 [Ceraceosorus bombacis]|uniref:Uncharacterized protein n=1 Tax=Ceraceosorus bombacis TaxID=401625 RepID=A0A0P1BNB9_9BASI|nr:hypothetical protein CBOM_03926 [Ceraceosorus bombacis]
MAKHVDGTDTPHGAEVTCTAARNARQLAVTLPTDVSSLKLEGKMKQKLQKDGLRRCFCAECQQGISSSPIYLNERHLAA